MAKAARGEGNAPSQQPVLVDFLGADLSIPEVVSGLRERHCGLCRVMVGLSDDLQLGVCEQRGCNFRNDEAMRGLQPLVRIWANKYRVSRPLQPDDPDLATLSDWLSHFPLTHLQIGLTQKGYLTQFWQTPTLHGRIQAALVGWLVGRAGLVVTHALEMGGRVAGEMVTARKKGARAEQRELAQSLAQLGQKSSEIADHLGVDRSLIDDWLEPNLPEWPGDRRGRNAQNSPAAE